MKAVQRCNCGGAACKSAKVEASAAVGPRGDMLAWGSAAKQRQKVGLTILGRPCGRAGMLDPTWRQADAMSSHPYPA